MGAIAQNEPPEAKTMEAIARNESPGEPPEAKTMGAIAQNESPEAKTMGAIVQKGQNHGSYRSKRSPRGHLDEAPMEMGLP